MCSPVRSIIPAITGSAPVITLAAFTMYIDYMSLRRISVKDRFRVWLKSILPLIEGDWDTETINLELNPYSKQCNCKYYPVPIINKETFFNEIKCLLKIGVLPTVQQSQYGAPLFIISRKEGTVSFITDYLRLKHQLVRNTYPLP